MLANISKDATTRPLENDDVVVVAMSTAKRLVLSWRGRKQSHDSSVGRLVGHGGGGSALGPGDNHELDEIAVVSSNADPCHVKYGSGTALSTINGPRLVPGWLYIIYEYILVCIGLL